MIVTVTLNPCIDHSIFVDQLMVGDTNRVACVERDAGGKGLNVSRVYAELGGNTIATGFLGGVAAAFIRQAMSDQGVAHEFIEIAGETRVNVSVEDNSKNPPTTFNERGPVISESEISSLVAWCQNPILVPDWVCLGGSIPPGIGKDAFKTIGAVFASRGIPLLLDADGEALIHGLELNPQFIKPNAAEAGRLLGQDIENEAQAISASQNLYERIGAGERYAVISRGKDGAVMTCSSGTFVGSSPKVESKSTIGSGDSMIGGMLWAIDAGLDVAEALRWGLAAGAATAVTDGREIGRKKVIELLFQEAHVNQV